MKPIKAGSTSKSIDLFIQDSSSTTGAGLTGLAFNTAGLTAYYHRPGANAAAITLATQTVTGAFSSGGFVAIDGTNMPGVYRMDIPDAALASGVDEVVIMLNGAANMAPVLQKIILTAMDLQDGVRGGMTALPNAAAEAAGGLYTRGTGAGQINQPANGRLDANTISVSGTAQTARDLGASVLLSAGTGTGQVSLTAGAVTVGTNNDKTGYTASTVTDKTGYSLSAGGIQAVWDALTSALTTAGSVGKRIADFLTGDAFVRLGAPAGASVSADVAAVKADTGAEATRRAKVVITGTVGAATTPSTTQFTPSALTPAGVDLNQFIGRTLVFDNDTTTAALRGQGATITASSAAALPLLTYSGTLTRAPASGDTFSIL